MFALYSVISLVIGLAAPIVVLVLVLQGTKSGRTRSLGIGGVVALFGALVWQYVVVLVVAALRIGTLTYGPWLYLPGSLAHAAGIILLALAVTNAVKSRPSAEPHGYFTNGIPQLTQQGPPAYQPGQVPGVTTPTGMAPAPNNNPASDPASNPASNPASFGQPVPPHQPPPGSPYL